MISVIIPMYNSKNTIVNTLDSVKNQSAFNYIKEIIIINDGSTDESLEIVKQYSELNKFMPIKLISKKNGGASTARNLGLKIANEKYIAFLDSDDQWDFNKIKVQIDILEKDKEIILLATNLNGQKFKRFFFKKFSYLTTIKTIDLAFKNFFQPSTVIFRKNILENIGYFPEDQRYAEEGNFFMKATNFGKCVLINESYLNFGDGKSGFGVSGLSGNIKEMQKGEIKNLKFALNKNFITKSIFLIAYIFSYIKYFRRIIITKLR